MLLGEYLIGHPSLLIIGITYAIIFTILIYKIKHKNTEEPFYDEVELLEQTQLNEYENTNFNIRENSSHLDRASEILGPDEFEYVNILAETSLNEPVSRDIKPLYVNMHDSQRQ